MLSISVILSTYNSPDYLQCVLKSFQGQRYQNFEIVVADDGSDTRTRNLIDSFREKSPISILHAWHEDKGFRAASARNHAVYQSSGDYLVFLDGDCMVFERFLEGHASLAEEKWMVRGSRVMLNKAYTHSIISGNRLPNNMLGWIYRKLRGDVKRIAALMKFLNINNKRKCNSWYGVKTCNLGVWKKDFYEVNGFNEDYVGWGHEDADLAVRLLRNGVKRKDGRQVVPVVHLWHKENDRSKLSSNESRLEDIIQSDVIRCANGVNRYHSQ